MSLFKGSNTEVINVCKGNSCRAVNLELCAFGEKIRLNTSKVHHSFCQYPWDKGDRSYSSIDRSDENITNTINIKESLKIDYKSYLTPCVSGHGSGLTCYQTTELSGTNRCRAVGSWCRSDIQDSCVTSQDGARTASDDSRLCSNKTFWENVGTDIHNGRLEGRGVRCNGRQMATIYPWYKWNVAEIFPGAKQNCEDHSDRVFRAGKPCSNRTYYLSVHNSEWCSTDRVSPQLICTNFSAWLEITAIDQTRLDDPHFCQESCATPGLDCVACTGEKFFNCSRSNTCIHPDLVCDGHPQCPDNEDEDYELCRKKYFNKKLVKPFATFKCNSTMYPKMFTIATACNGIPECLDGLDEGNCNTDSVTTPVLVIALFLVVGLFFGLKISHYMAFIKINNKAMEETFQFEELIQHLRENPGDQENNRKINTFFLNIFNTKETKFNKVFLCMFYNVLEKALENKVGEVFCYLKRNIHPDVTKSIIKHKVYANLRVNEFIRERIRSEGPLTKLQDKVTSTPSLRMTLSTLWALSSLLSHFGDIVKDASLAGSLLVITGGTDAIVEFPTNFSSAIVILWMVTIIIPIVLSSLNLAITQPFLVFPRLRATRGGRALAALGCLVLSPLNTVILKTRLEMTQQQAIEAARVLGADTMDLYNQCDVIEAKVQEYLLIEIGE